MLTFIIALRFTKHFTILHGFFSLGFIHIRIVIERAKEQVKAEDVRAAIAKRQYVLDSTKRKSLQPGNADKFLHTWKELTNPAPIPGATVNIPQRRDETKQRVSNHMPYSPPIKKTFIHDFFGSQLTIGDLRIGKQLTRKKHRLEITENQLMIDNVPQEVNQGDLERIKLLIREMRQ